MKLGFHIGKQYFGVTFGGPGAETFPQAVNWPRDVPLGEEGRLTRPYAQHSTVRVALCARSGDAGSIEWEMFRDGSDEPSSHPVLDLLARPNSYMAGNMLIAGTIVSQDLFGECFWYYPGMQVAPVQSRALEDRFPLQRGVLQILDPRQVSHSLNERTGEVAWKWRNSLGQEEALDGRFLTQFREYNPYSTVRGLPRLAAAAMDAEGDFFAQQWNINFFKRGGTPSGLLVPGVSALMTPEQRADMLRTWKEKHGGRRNAVGILPPGWDFKDFGMNMHDMDFAALRGLSQERILAVYGVPPFRAGVLEKANYANAREQEKIYWRHTLMPLLKGLQDVINHDFLPKLGVSGWMAKPKLGPVAAMVEDHEKKSETARRYWEMGIPFREINERLELGFDPGKIPSADTGFLPLNLIPADMAGESMSMAGPAGTPESNQEPPQEVAAGVLPPANEQRRALVWKNIITRTFDLETAFNRVVRSHFKSLEQESLRSLEGVKGWRLRNQKAPSSDFFLFEMEQANERIIRLTQPLYRRTVQRAGDGLFAELGLATSFDLASPQAILLIARQAIRIKGINETVAKLLQQSLGEGLMAGEGIDLLRDRVENVFRASQGRSRAIARTEVGSSFNGGRQVAMQEAGINRQEWLTARDGDVREAHIRVDGEVAVLGQNFSNGLAYPQDPNGPAREVVNCRCVAVPVVEGEAA